MTCAVPGTVASSCRPHSRFLVAKQDDFWHASSRYIAPVRRRPPQLAWGAGRPICEPRRLVAVHGHPLRAPADFAVGRRADGSAAVALRAALLQGQQLLGAKRLVVDLRRRLDEVLEVGPQQEVPQVDELAVVLVLDVDDAPPVLPGGDLLAVDNDGLLGADDGKGDKALRTC